MLRNALWQVADTLRSLPNTNKDQILLAITLLVWGKLSEQARIPESEKFSSDEDINERFNNFCQSKHLDFVSNSFKEIPGSTKDVLKNLADSKLFAKLEFEDAAAHLASKAGPGYGTCIPEFADIIVHLAGFKKTNTVYCPWDEAGQLSSRVNSNYPVYVETISRDCIASIVSKVVDHKIDINNTDPLRSPSAIADGKLTKFDISISVPPFGLRFKPDEMKNDLFGRWPNKTSSGDLLVIYHLLAQTISRVVVVLPLKILFSTGAEAEFRKKMVNAGKVMAVATFPGGMLYSTSIPCCILVIDPNGGHDRVRFIDVASSDFVEKQKRNVVISNPTKLADEILDGGEDQEYVTTASKGEIAENKYDLQVSTYVLSNSQKRVAEVIGDRESRRISDISEIGKTVHPKAVVDEGQERALTYDMFSFKQYGYLSKPSKEIYFDDGLISIHQYLKAHDILVVTKGTGVGTVGIVPSIGESEVWLPPSFTTVLRCWSDSLIDPRVLYFQLRSALGEVLLDNVTVKSSMPVIRLSQFRDIEILIPDDKESNEIIETFEKEVSLQNDINDLIKEQEKVKSAVKLFNV